MRAFTSAAPAAPPPPPLHTGSPLRVGETCLLRRPNQWFDVICQLRGIDREQASVRILDHFEIVQLLWLRRWGTAMNASEEEQELFAVALPIMVGLLASGHYAHPCQTVEAAITMAKRLREAVTVECQTQPKE